MNSEEELESTACRTLPVSRSFRLKINKTSHINSGRKKNLAYKDHKNMHTLLNQIPKEK